MKRSLALAVLATALGGCGLIYTNVHGPRSWRAATPNEVKTTPNDEVVTGEACSQSLLYLVAWGDFGYQKASEDALKGKEGVLYDVKTDMKVTSVLLGLYTETCTHLTARVGKL